MSSSALPETARHILVHRIQHYVTGLERARRQPNRREAYHTLVALEQLEAGNFEEGEQAMRNAEQLVAIPVAIAGVQGIHDSMTTHQLKERLAGILARVASP